jgi:hypothetical protein
MTNPGGWPTGPLESGSFYDRRDLCNAAADFRDAVFDVIRTILRKVSR